MPAAKTVLLSCATNFDNGHLFVVFDKRIVLDNGKTQWGEEHHLSVAPAYWAKTPTGWEPRPAPDLGKRLDECDAHLTDMGWPAMTAEDRALIASHDLVRPSFPLPPKPTS